MFAKLIKLKTVNGVLERETFYQNMSAVDSIFVSTVDNKGKTPCLKFCVDDYSYDVDMTVEELENLEIFI